MVKVKKYNAIKNFDSDVSKSFVKGAAILTVSMVIVKVFGMLDKVILERIFSSFVMHGAQGGDGSFGMGLYANAFELFVVIFTVATGGLPIAISRLVSQNMTQKRYKDVRLIHKISVPFFAILGFVCLLVIVAASIPYTQFVIHSPYAVYPMMCLAPTVFFGCLASAYRGYYEGQRNMTPTAISEIIEAVVKLIFGALFAYVILYFGMQSYHETHSFLGMTFKDGYDAERTIIAFSVSGAIMGISLGSMCSFLYCFLKFKIQGDGIPEEYYLRSVDARSKRETFITILKTGIPIAGGALIMSLGSFVDSIIIQNVLLNLAETHGQELQNQYGQFYRPEDFGVGGKITIHTSLWGCYSNALTLMQLVTAVTQVFGSSAMPNVTSAWTKGDKGELRRSINTVLKMTMMFTLPMAFGLCVLAHPIMGLIYRSESIHQIGGNVLAVMGITTIFTAIITPICSMLNGIGKVKIPMILYTICMIVKVCTSWIFVSIPSINIQGATAGSMVSYALICVIGMFLLIKYSGVVPDFFNTTLKPFIAAVCSSAAAFFSYRLLADNFRATAICLSVLIAVIVIAVVYFIGHLIAGTSPAGKHFSGETKRAHRYISLVVGVVLGIAAGFASYKVVFSLPGTFFMRVTTVFAILLAIIVYVAVLLIIHTFSAEEIKFLPKGEKIAKTLEKFHLIG